jgi:ABC-2 type transport system ATP-binding protein
MRAGEQLTYLAELHGTTPAAAIQSTARWLDRFGLKDRARDDIQKLSHGNQQRVQLAAALVFDPLMLILDEPFAGLDPEAVDSMSEVLHERATAGVPVVGIIQRGHLIASGTVDELRGRGPERWWVDAPNATDGWSGRVPGTKVVRTDGSRVLIEVNGAIDDQALLRAALATGPVHEFRRDEPSLLEIFREAMTEEKVAAVT